MNWPFVRPRTWLVTGASRGIGRAVAEAALGAGDRVAGLARDVTPLTESVTRHEGRLAAYSVDVADRERVFAAVERATADLGPPDVLVCNAGRMLFGMVEETTEAEARDHLDVNLFGALWPVQAVLPRMRDRGGGHILPVTVQDAGGGSAGVGLYCAGKAALNALSEALAAEVAGFGVKVTIVEPGPHATGLDGPGLTMTAEHEAYAARRAELFGADSSAEPVLGRPADAAARIVEVTRMVEPPGRISIVAE
ncbi:SDR family NAD(P)-dependent oxidoreductase [Spirillospora sp. NBC_00431]